MKPRILVFVQGTIGDTTVSIPALRALHRHYGGNLETTLLHEVHSHLPFNPRDVLAETGLVHHFLSYPFTFNRSQQRLAAIRLFFSVAKRRFDAVYYLIAPGREVAQIKRDKMFFTMCGVKAKHGFIDLGQDCFMPRKANGALGRVSHEALLRLTILERCGIDTSEESALQKPVFSLPFIYANEAEEWMKAQVGFDTAKPMIAIAPGAKKRSCLWPAERFLEIGRKVRDNLDAQLVVVGGAAERDLATALVESWNTGYNACGSLSVLGSAALLERCELLFGLDTGTTHLAGALGTPCVAIYAAQDWPGRWEPMGVGHHVLRNDPPCAGCRLKICKELTHPCMTNISVEEAWQHIKQVWDQRARPKTPIACRDAS